MKNEIILYRADKQSDTIEVVVENETVWLSQQQLATLFSQTKQNISLHINNCFKEQELEKEATVKKSLTVQKEGNRKVERLIELYSLDVIISVGYRVKSKQGTQFRIWANKVLKEYLLKGYSVNNRLNRVEDSLESLKNKVDQIDLQINAHLIPNQGVFFDGQVFDAYELTTRIIRSAKESIVLIDNYIDESSLVQLSKKENNVSVLLLSKTIGKQLQLDVKKANEQYGKFQLKPFQLSHDRFIIIDQKEVYHLGASLKDLGKKWFAFSKLETTSVASLLKSIINLK
jgi:hypothetical protein